MPSQYLTTSEAPLFGLTSVDSGQITRASTLIDAYLRRPEGLVWGADSQGQPSYMVGAAPTLQFTLSSPISPGSTVTVPLTGPTQMLQVGDVLVLDQGNPSLTEACVICTTTGSGSGGVGPAVVALQTVMNAHSIGATANAGMVIEEQRSMPDSRPITRVARTPMMRLISGIGRYGYGRRGDGANYNMEEFNLLAALSRFGGPPVWELFQQPLNYSWDVQTGQVWVPAGIMLAYYSEVKLRYVAGFPANAIPPIIKLACAQLIQSMQNFPSLGDTRSYKAGDTNVTRFISSALDADIRAQLKPYVARTFI